MSFCKKEGQYDLYETFRGKLVTSEYHKGEEGCYIGTCRIVSWDLSRVRVINSKQ